MCLTALGQLPVRRSGVSAAGRGCALLGRHSPSMLCSWGPCPSSSRRRSLNVCCLPAADVAVLRRLACVQVCSTVVSVLRHPGACTPRQKGLERETILCGHLKGHAAAVTAALVKVDVGEPLRSPHLLRSFCTAALALFKNLFLRLQGA